MLHSTVAPSSLGKRYMPEPVIQWNFLLLSHRSVLIAQLVGSLAQKWFMLPTEYFYDPEVSKSLCTTFSIGFHESLLNGLCHTPKQGNITSHAYIICHVSQCCGSNSPPFLHVPVYLCKRCCEPIHRLSCNVFDLVQPWYAGWSASRNLLQPFAGLYDLQEKPTLGRR